MPNFSSSEQHLLSLFTTGASFRFGEEACRVVFAGKPTAPDGEPKTDVYVRCQKNSNHEQFELKISYKQQNADFLENKINAERAAQILGTNWSVIIQRAISPLQTCFQSKPLVYKNALRHTDAGSITLGWKFEFLFGRRGGDLSGIIPLQPNQKLDIFSGRNLSESKRNASVNGQIFENSGVADYIIVEDDVQTLQAAIDVLMPIAGYARREDVCFACKALNCRTLHDPIKWDGDRPLAVHIRWTVSHGKLTPQYVFNTPLVVKGNEVGNQLLNAMSQLGISTTNDITANNCADGIVYCG